MTFLLVNWFWLTFFFFKFLFEAFALHPLLPHQKKNHSISYWFRIHSLISISFSGIFRLLGLYLLAFFHIFPEEYKIVWYMFSNFVRIVWLTLHLKCDKSQKQKTKIHFECFKFSSDGKTDGLFSLQHTRTHSKWYLTARMPHIFAFRTFANYFQFNRNVLFFIHCYRFQILINSFEFLAFVFLLPNSKWFQRRKSTPNSFFIRNSFYFSFYFFFIVEQDLLPLSLPSLYTRIVRHFSLERKLHWKTYRNTLWTPIQLRSAMVYMCTGEPRIAAATAATEVKKRKREKILLITWNTKWKKITHSVES